MICGEDMSKVKQEDFKKFVSEVALAINMIGNDLIKTQTILYNLLDEMGKMEKPTCNTCGKDLMIPILNNIERNETCPLCGDNIYGSEQPSFENWDNGTELEEE